MHANGTTPTPLRKAVPCLTVRQLLRANLGKRVTLSLSAGEKSETRSVTGTVTKLLEEKPEMGEGGVEAAIPMPVVRGATYTYTPPKATSPFEDPAYAGSFPDGGTLTRTITPLGGDYLVIENTETGRLVLPVSQVQSVGGPDVVTETTREEEVFTRTKRLSFDFGKDAANKPVSLHLFYFTPGLRWIPTYRLSGDLKDHADLALQGEILNDVEDLKGAALDLVVGVPNFRFKDAISPLSLERQMRTVFANMDRNNGFSNSTFLQSQFSNGDNRAFAPGGAPAVPAAPAELAGAAEQDLYSRSFPNFTLRKGARAAIPMLQTTAPIRHLYTYDVKARRSRSTGGIIKGAQDDQSSPLKISFNNIWHQLEIKNDTKDPWTTGAALLMRGNLPIGQDLLTYTPPGSSTLLPVTIAIDLRGTTDEEEIERHPNALRFDTWDYAQVKKKGTITIASFRTEKSAMRITLSTGGKVESASDDGKIKINDFRPDDWDDPSFMRPTTTPTSPGNSTSTPAKPKPSPTPSVPTSTDGACEEATIRAATVRERPCWHRAGRWIARLQSRLCYGNVSRALYAEGRTWDRLSGSTVFDPDSDRRELAEVSRSMEGGVRSSHFSVRRRGAVGSASCRSSGGRAFAVHTFSVRRGGRVRSSHFSVRGWGRVRSSHFSVRGGGGVRESRLQAASPRNVAPPPSPTPYPPHPPLALSPPKTDNPLGRDTSKRKEHVMKCLRALSMLGLSVAAFLCQFACSKEAAPSTSTAPAPTTPPSATTAPSVESLRKAAEQGDASAQFKLGVCYAKAEGVPQDLHEAVKWYREAADQGYAPAQYNLGVAYDQGNGVAEDLSAAVNWYRKAAEQGLAAAQDNLGLCYVTGEGVPQDFHEAVKWFRKAAEQGYAPAQHDLGFSYAQGNGVARDLPAAFNWYRKAAEQGLAAAQTNLGFCYEQGKGVEQDVHEAVKWYRKAAEQGDAAAQHNLGVSYAKGRGVEKDEREAVNWYRKAAEQGVAAAQYNLAVCYEAGNGVGQDQVEAVKWYRKAAEHGLAVAQCRLAACHQEGDGVAKDQAEALTPRERCFVHTSQPVHGFIVRSIKRMISASTPILSSAPIRASFNKISELPIRLPQCNPKILMTYSL